MNWKHVIASGVLILSLVACAGRPAEPVVEVPKSPVVWDDVTCGSNAGLKAAMDAAGFRPLFLGHDSNDQALILVVDAGGAWVQIRVVDAETACVIEHGSESLLLIHVPGRSAQQ